MSKIHRARKAIVAGFGAFSASVASAAPAGLDGNDWAAAAGVGLLVGVLTWLTPNRPADPQP